jgi:hypothetical protein
MPNACEPLGGVWRSTVFGLGWTLGGVVELADFEQPWMIVCAPAITCVGVAVLAAEVPLSLVGDLATWPVVAARKRGDAWATWWGYPAEERIPLSPERELPAQLLPPIPENGSGPPPGTTPPPAQTGDQGGTSLPPSSLSAPQNLKG